VGNCSEIPVEILELEYPFVCLDKEFMIDTAGPGRFRGGPAITYTNQCLVESEISLSCDRMRYGPWGVFGGATAMPQALYEVLDLDAPFEHGWSPVDTLRPISGRFDSDDRADAEGEHYRTSKFSHVKVPAGTTLRIVNAAGGGYGSPLEREPASVLGDVRNELVSPEAARLHYGVVLSEDALAVDEDATRRLRDELRDDPPPIELRGWRGRDWFDGKDA
jgi:N-methylhydantoinase B